MGIKPSSKNGFALLVICLAFASCVPSGRLTTPSGKPEIVISKASIKDLRDAIVNQMLTDGFTPLETSEYMMVFSKHVPGGAIFDRADKSLEATFTFVQLGTDIRIVHSRALIAYKGTMLQKVKELDSIEELEVQQMWLNNIAPNVQRRPSSQLKGT